jgi:hypothetical protein
MLITPKPCLYISFWALIYGYLLIQSFKPIRDHQKALYKDLIKIIKKLIWLITPNPCLYISFWELIYIYLIHYYHLSLLGLIRRLYLRTSSKSIKIKYANYFKTLLVHFILRIDLRISYLVLSFEPIWAHQKALYKDLIKTIKKLIRLITPKPCLYISFWGLIYRYLIHYYHLSLLGLIRRLYIRTWSK